VGVAHSGNYQSGGAFTFGGQLFSQLFRGHITAAFFDFKNADVVFANVSL
jgi:hypothetical protein